MQCAKPGAEIAASADPAVLAADYARVVQELAEARQQQAATGEILGIISRAPTDLQPVLDAVAESAARVCEALDASIWRLNGDRLRLVAHHGPIHQGPVGEFTIPLVRGTVNGRAVLDQSTVHVADVQAETKEFPETSQYAYARQLGHRTILSVPLMREGVAIGSIALRRAEVELFTERQVALLHTFANQAVIAIENARLFEAEQAHTRELQESLEYQTATSEVLNVISRSPNELQPVLGTIVQTARRLCGAERAIVTMLRDGKYHLVAHDGAPPDYVEYLTRNPLVPDRGTATGRAALERKAVQIPNVLVDAEWTGLARLRMGKTQTALGVPLLRKGEVIGVITMTHTEVKPFTEKQIELVTTFADQAVIAINNVGLFEEVQARTKELTESLKQQTATADVLKVISRSAFDLQTVLDALVNSSAQLCEADMAQLLRPTGKEAGYYSAANYGFSSEYSEYVRTLRFPPGQGSLTGRILLGRKPVQIPDVLADPQYVLTEAQRLGGFRTHLGVPLLREGAPIGVLVLSRRAVRPFTDKQIELAATFADQAVIAIENARLFEEVQARSRELAEALEYQTATGDVLNVISRSPSQLQPVLDAIVETAGRLCQADFAVVYQLREDGNYHFVAGSNVPPEFLEYLREHPIAPGRATVTGRAALERRTMTIPDVLADPDYNWREGQEIGKFRSNLAVPLLRHGVAVGVITVVHRTVKPFTDRQIELVTTFADQAVIAINNVGLFEEVQARTRELQESLEYQTATSEVLNVISRSPSQLQPVLDAIVQTAARLCEAELALFFKLQDGKCHLAGSNNADAAYVKYLSEHPVRLDRGSCVGRTALECCTIHLPDCLADPEYTKLDYQRIGKHRTMLGVPLLRDGIPIGVISLQHTAVKPFSEKQIQLVTTFADQAVIAIENTRLFEAEQTRTRELTERTRELQESLEYQTATSDVLGVISRSPHELQPVLNTVVDTAKRLCTADRAFFSVLREGRIHLVTTSGVPENIIDEFRGKRIVPGRGSPASRALLEKRAIHIEDVRLDPEFTLYDVNEPNRARTLLSVPLLRGDNVIGVISVARIAAVPFTQRQIDLVTTFASQAVIAINNVGLFEEVQARTRELARSVAELKALSEVSQAVNASLDLETVLSTILAHACQMSESGGGAIYVFDETNDEYVLAAGHNMSNELIAAVRAQRLRRGTPVVGECVEQCATVQVPDVALAGSYPLFDVLRRGGIKALLAVPLLHREKAIGALLVRRMSTGAFAPETVRLLQNFATQSSLAIYNARLFHEIEEKSRELEIASQHKSQFVASMSHELRTPLAAMLGYAELLKEGIYGALPEKSAPIVTRIQSNGKHLLGLINTVLDISKIEAGQFKLNLAEYALASVIETVRVATESLAAAKKLALETNVTKDLPCGLGDEQRLTQVLLNLVGNAIKFTDAGEVRITAATANGHYALSVSDTGPGIPPQERDKIFEKFHQIDSSITKAKGGTGLGLAIAKQIVEMHGGRIWVESTVGQGSTFRMELPVRATAAAGASS
jgi:GAF domain-containing protein